MTDVVRSEELYSKLLAFARFFTRRFSRLDVQGLEHLPKTGGAIAYANHISYADPLILAAALAEWGRHPRALAKHSLFEIPILGKLLLKMGHVPVERGTERATVALAAAIEAVREGSLVALYPEGTIPTKGEWLGDFKTGAARLALATGAPVIPVAQVGAERIIPASKENGRLLPLLKAFFKRPRVTVVIGEPFIPLELSGGGSPEDRETVQAANEQLRLAMMGLLKDLKPGCPTPLASRPKRGLSA